MPSFAELVVRRPFPRAAFQAVPAVKPALAARLKFARFLEMPESDFEASVRELEASEAFRGLQQAGVVSLVAYPRARFSHRSGALELRGSCDSLAELFDGRNDLFPLIQRIGQESFEACFIQGEELSDDGRAKRCGISSAEAATLRDFMDRVYLRAELAGPVESAATQVFSAVAGIEVEEGRPILGFFHREIWKGRYHLDGEKRAHYMRAIAPAEARRAEEVLRRLELFEQRKTTLYRVLEALLDVQADFLATGDSERRVALTQRTLAARLRVTPSVLNQVISNKSVRLPAGLDVPIKTLLPSKKSLSRGRLYDLASARPELSDEALRWEMGRLHGASLSRRSVAQYRKELGLAGAGRRPLGRDIPAAAAAGAWNG